MKQAAIYLTLLLMIMKLSLNAQPSQEIKSTFDFEIEKYLGTWYEIARFDHRFERNLQGVSANYSLTDNGKIDVVNKGYKNSLQGSVSIANGKARMVSPTTPRRLEVSFFLWFYSPYNILEIDKDYSYVMIGTGSDNYLWIMSRTPQMEKETFDMLIEKAKKRGYDTSKLILVDQPKK
jgi:lipocalin